MQIFKRNLTKLEEVLLLLLLLILLLLLLLLLFFCSVTMAVKNFPFLSRAMAMEAAAAAVMPDADRHSSSTPQSPKASITFLDKTDETHLIFFKSNI
jgi:hypothetical protein